MSNYTSNLLCHFVGRSKENDDERFELLITIIRSCRLIANVNAPNNLETSFFTGYECDRLERYLGVVIVFAFAISQMMHWQSTRKSTVVSVWDLKRHLSHKKVHIL